MTKFLFGLYGLVAYLIFFVTFLYAIAFVENLPLVPKAIDTGPSGALVPALVVNALLLGAFAIQHSLMARPFFKRWWTRFVPHAIERSTYVLLASLILVALFAFWRPLTQPIWSFSGPAAIALTAISWAGFGLVLASTFLINHFELFGLKQVWDKMRERKAADPHFVTPLFYRLVRHPLYLGFILAFWSAPTMTLGHLEFAVATLGYILIAIQLEEHDLTAVFGERYRAYKRQVGMLLPNVLGGGKASAPDKAKAA
jgi:protein-S-isoprenylcysteine O-methyltransferase Ste14